MAEKKTRKIEDLLHELGSKIEVLIAEAKEATGELRDEIEEKVQELKKKKEDLEGDIDDFRKKEQWQEAKSHFVSAIAELRQAAEAVISTLKK